MRTIHQTEASECGLACIAMIAGHFGQHHDLRDLRRRFAISLKGAKLSQMIDVSAHLGFSTRPVRVDLDEIGLLRLPCILHWNLNHFVVLKQTKRSSALNAEQFLIVDPAVGERKLSAAEFSKCFTGVALELAPSPAFSPRALPKTVGISQLMGPIKGIWLAVAKALVVAATLELLILIFPLLNQFIIDEVIVSGDHELLAVLAIGFSILLLTQNCLSYARSRFLSRWSIDIGFQWSTRVFAHLLKLPASYFEKRHLGDIVSRFGSIGSIQSTLTSLVVESALDGIMAIFALAMMCLYSIKLALVVFICAVLYIALRTAFYHQFREASRERLLLSAKESTNFIESLRAIIPIKLFSHEYRRVSLWQNIHADVVNRDFKTQKLALVFRSANSTLSGFQSLMLLYLGASLVMDRQITIGMLMAFTSYSSTFTAKFFSLVDTYIDTRMLSLHSERLADIVLEPAEDLSKRSIDTGHLMPSISLRAVSFRHGDGEPWLFRNANLDIMPHESVALVGPSGSGKTTLCKIILGLLEPTSGEVLIGGVSIKQLGTSYRQVIGTVLQDDVLLAGSIAENISFFDENLDQSVVEHCARLASVHDEIIAMPMGYHTLVGDMGSSLSGGQKQRILLARALYKRPKILAMDEATSHLDVANERRVIKAIRDLSITRIFVAHRLETINSADRVVQIYGGSVRERQRQESPT